MRKIKQTLVLFITILTLASIAVIAPSLTRGQGQGPGNLLPLSVNVVNESLPVRDVENPARSPFRQTFTIPVLPGNSLGVISLAPAPAGKALVLEYVTAQCELPVGQKATLHIAFITPSGFRRTLSFPILHYQKSLSLQYGGAYRDIYHASEQIRVYVAPAEAAALAAEVERSSTEDSAVCSFHMAGYTVDGQ